MNSAQRLGSLDLLRGVAVLGILVVNIQLFAMPVAGVLSPKLVSELQGGDFIVWFVSHVLFEGKFIALFSALFGASIVMLTQIHRSKGLDHWACHWRRMAALGLIGIAHGVLLWMGDILFLYALIGMLAFLFVDRDVRYLLTWGIIIFAVPIVAYVVAGWGISELPVSGFVALASSAPSVHEQVVTAVNAYQGSWMEQLQQRLTEVATRYFVGIPTSLGWLVLGCMLVGMAGYKSGFLTASWSARSYIKTSLWGFVVGITLSIAGVMHREAYDWEILSGFLIADQLNQIAIPFTAIGWAALVMLIYKQGWLQKALWPLVAVGRTALSCYLLQTLLCTAIFYGFGLGLYGELTRVEQLVVVIGVWLALLLAAPLWLYRFRMGPAEWLLRRASS
ncbi:DUF418 domain-containing protein [Halorhodospira halochloris]|uniref:DUF418 domain-containing protein n=1 Tax=Halorhodospira halochloris TaxID=1052 RepID=UPI001EE9AD25|nr:DUF418 domain-containing protein [Halorhodospira halochloris]MCG5529909.1 DUF418 domain-containing protein [Halorhodospira halochloris]